MLQTEYIPKLEHGLRNKFVSERSKNPDIHFTMVTAPVTSHIQEFSYIDIRTNSFMRKFGPEDAGGNKQSQLVVTFKAGEGRGPTYIYYFTDHAWGRQIYDEMCLSSHPYGEVLYPRIVHNNSVPYTQQNN